MGCAAQAVAGSKIKVKFVLAININDSIHVLMFINRQLLFLGLTHLMHKRV